MATIQLITDIFIGHFLRTDEGDVTSCTHESILSTGPNTDNDKWGKRLIDWLQISKSNRYLWLDTRNRLRCKIRSRT